MQTLLPNLVLIGVCLLGALPVAAQPQADTPVDTLADIGNGAATPTAPQPLWELGLFGLTGSQLAYPGSAHRVHPRLVLPFFVYRGPLLRADQEGIGLRAKLAPRVELDIGVAGAFGSNASDSAVRQGMPNIGTLVEFGPRLRIDLGAAPGNGRWRLSLPVRGVFDLSHGLATRGISAEPELGWARYQPGGNSYRASVGAVLGNLRLTDTFYGVAPAFATATRPTYAASAGLVSWRLSASAGWAVSRDWYVFGFTRWDSVAGAANRNSPLVERTGGASAGIGLSWTALRSSRSVGE